MIANVLLDPTETCPRCCYLPLETEDVNECSYCVVYREADLTAELASLTRNRPMTPEHKARAAEIRAELHDPEMVSLDPMHPLFYGGDIDTLKNLVDSEA
jgi:hypothetical protein